MSRDSATAEPITVNFFIGVLLPGHQYTPRTF
jgi:hypothetical protein